MNKPSLKKIIVLISLTITGIVPAMAQQNIQFTQYIFNSLSVNPAYAGYKEEWYAQMALRNQWVGINGGPKTGQLSIDGLIDPINKRMGIGMQLTSDKLGPQQSTSAYVNYAYRLKLDAEDTQRLSFGMGLGVTNYKLDASMLNPVELDDTQISTGMTNAYIPDARVGIYYYNPKFYLGVSIMDLFSGDKTNNFFNWDNSSGINIQRKRHLYFIAGLLINITEDVKLKPSILIKEDFKGPTSFDINGMFVFVDKIWFGASYRSGVKLWNKSYDNGLNLANTNSISGVAQFYVTERLRVGYSYDFQINGLASYQNGSHELTVGLTFPSKTNRLLSPRFF